MPLHTIQQAQFLLFYLQKTISHDAELIGGFGKGKVESEHDIDVYFPTTKSTTHLKKKLLKLLDAKSVEVTDWNGWYFRETFFGDVDVFFSIKDFDY